MKSSQDDLFDGQADIAPEGWVSPACRIHKDGPLTFVLIHGQAVYAYGEEDPAMKRLSWVGVIEHGFATYEQVAKATKQSRRALQYWVKRYREKGASALGDGPRSGAPIKVTEEIKQRIARLRAQKLKIAEIARLCRISVPSVKLELQRQKAAREESQANLEEAEPMVEEEFFAQADAGEAQAAQEAAAVAMPEAAPEAPRTAAATVEEPAPKAYSEEDEQRMAKDRSEERKLAAAGLIDDVRPLFAPADGAECAGAFMAVALLASHPCLKTLREAFSPFKAAFYGLRTMAMAWVLMALLRIKCSEQIREKDARALGILLGLDRAPEVKTIRRKLHALVGQNRALYWMDRLARERVAAHGSEVYTLQIDGHLVVYAGGQKMGMVFSARTQRVGKAQTENWVHLPHGGGALFMVTSPFNEGLSGMLEGIVESACEVSGKERLHLVFDRGGQDAETFERLLAKGHHFTTYRKGAGENLPLDLFEKTPTTIGKRTYDYAPLDLDFEMPVYEKKTSASGKASRVMTNRTLALREIRFVRSDNEQTSVLTSLPREGHDPVSVGAALFDRTGNQENYFKYMRAEFSMDAKPIYELDPILDENLTHPNPNYLDLQKQKRDLAKERRAALGRFDPSLLRATPKQARRALVSRSEKELAERIVALDRRILRLKLKLKLTPSRESLPKGEYKKMNEQARALTYGFKMTAEEIERQLVQMLAAHYPNAAKEGHKLIAAALKTPGDVRLEPGKIVVRLRPQSSPKRTQAINALLEELNAKKTVYPGSHRVICFEPSPDPINVFHSPKKRN